MPRAWFKICRFWVTQARGNHRPVGARFWVERCLVREGGADSLLGSGSLGLQRSEAQQGEPVRMALAGHQFPRAFAVTLGTPAAHETPMVQEEGTVASLGVRRQLRFAVAYRWLGGISVRSRNRACHCRPRSEPGGADWPLLATSASAAIYSFGDSPGNWPSPR